jgi:Uma2 family endonuclease
MASSTAISVEEYLHSSYEPDCDYVDGELVERNVGELKHSFLQNILGVYLHGLSRRLGFRVGTELRMRISATRFRIPDLTVMLRSQPLESVPTHPPFLCIEIVSPDDRMIHIIERVKEYLAFGVNHVWVVDPASRTAYAYTKDEGREVRDRLTTQNPEISVSLADLFAELDEALRDDA